MKRPPRLMFKLFLLQVFLTLLISIPLQSANARSEAARDTIKVRLMQYQYRGDTLPIRKLVRQNTRHKLHGKRIDKIIINGEGLNDSRYRETKVVLLINNIRQGRPKVLTQRTILKLNPYERNIVGKDIRSIKVKILGDAYIKAFKVKTLSQRNYAPRHLSININKTFNRTRRFSVMRYISHRSRVNPNALVSSVTVEVKGFGEVIIRGRGQRVGKVKLLGSSRVRRFRVDGRLSLDEINIKTTGSVKIYTIGVNFGRH